MLVTDFCLNCGAQTTGPLFIDELGPHTVCQHCGGSFDTDAFYRYVNENEAAAIVERREPKGLFVLDTGIEIVGIDNRTGDAWTEEFPDLTECLLWLAGEREKEENDV